MATAAVFAPFAMLTAFASFTFGVFASGSLGQGSGNGWH
jgi:hypothetical protein